jgi:hypothetical protein
LRADEVPEATAAVVSILLIVMPDRRRDTG